MNLGGKNISNSHQSVKGKQRRGPLNNISDRKNQMENEQDNLSDYNGKNTNYSQGQANQHSNSNNNNNNNQYGNKSNVFGQQTRHQVNDNKLTNQSLHQIDALKQALRDAVDENDFLRNRVTEIEALYAAAEDEIERRDSCIQELIIQIQKMSDAESFSDQQCNNLRMTNSQ